MRGRLILCVLVLTLLLTAGLPAIPIMGSTLSDDPTNADKAVATFEARTTLGRVVERYIQAIGGRAAFQKLTTRVCSGELVTDLSSRTPPVKETFTIEASAKASGMWLLVSRGSDGVHKHGSDGKVGWRQDLDGVSRDKSIKRLKMAFLLDPQGPLHLEDYFPAMDLMGTDVKGGRDVYVVESERDKAHYTLYFDVETGMLAQIGYYWQLQDYRELDGVKFPFRIVTSRKGGSSTYVFDEVRHNVALEDAVFAEPDLEVVLADVFKDINDPKVLPMLKHLPFRHGGMNVPSQDGRLLYDLIIQNGYKRGLEIGTSNGYSTLWLGLAFRETGGQVITIEYEPLSAREAQENFKKAGLDDVIDSRINDAFKEIPEIEGEFDFVFIDASKPDYIDFFKLVRDRMTPGGAITAHNVASHDRSMRDFLELVQNDPDLETTIHRVSTQGVSVSRVRE